MSKLVLPYPSVQVLRKQEAVKYLGMSVVEFDRLRKSGIIPAPLKHCKNPKWSINQLNKAISTLEGEENDFEKMLSDFNAPN